MKKIISLLFFISVSVFAGHETGNGGDVVVCEKTDGTFTYELLDIYEAREKHLLKIDFNPIEDTAENQAFYQLDKIKFWTDSIFFKDGINNFMSRVEFVKKELVDISDSHHTYIPSYCQIKQIAINDQMNKIYINEALWNRLDSNNKAALILHELIYEQMINNGHNNSVQARLLNGYLHGNSEYLFPDGELDEQKIEDFFKIVELSSLNLSQLISIYEDSPVHRARHEAFSGILEFGYNNNEALDIALSVLYTNDIKNDYFLRIIDFLTRMSDLKSYWGDKMDHFKNYIELNLNTIDQSESFYNRTRKSLFFLGEIVERDNDEDNIYIQKIIDLISKTKKISDLNYSTKAEIIDRAYNVLKKLNSQKTLAKYFEKILSGTSPKNEFDFAYIIDQMSSYGGLRFKNIVEERFIKNLTSCQNYRYCPREQNKKILIIYSAKFSKSEVLINILKDAIAGSDEYINKNDSLEVVSESLSKHSLYNQLKIELQKIFYEDLTSKKFEFMYYLGQIYKHIKMPPNLMNSVTESVKKREFVSSSVLYDFVEQINYTSTNHCDEFQNMLGYLLEYSHYLDTLTVLRNIRKMRFITKYVDSVFALKLKVNFGYEAVLSEYLSALIEKKISIELLDIIKSISQSSTNDYTIKLAKKIIKFNETN